MANRKLTVVGGSVVTPAGVLKDACVTIGGGLITGVSASPPHASEPDLDIIDCSGDKLLPGFIDVHTHGGAGFDFVDDTPETIESLSGYYLRHGVTSVLATLSPLSHELLLPAVRRLAAFCKQSKGEANIKGIHLEGPYINRSMSGGNKKEYIENPDFNRWLEVFGAGEGFIKVITVAPELPGIDRIIGHAAANGIVVALGHSAADRETTAAAVRLGASQVTHLYNAMPGLHHRVPGLLAEALLSEALDAQLIADGVHVHPQMIRLAIRAKSPDHVMVITDSMRGAGLADGEYISAGHKVRVRGGVSKMDDGTLAGSTLVFEKGFRLIFSLPEVDLRAASKMTSSNAARSLGMTNVGSIEPGMKADIVVLDKDCGVKMTLLNGNVVYRRTP